MKKLHSHESISCVSAFKSCDTWLTKLNMGVSSFPLSSNGSKTRVSHCRDDIADKLSWILGAEDLSERETKFVCTHICLSRIRRISDDPPNNAIRGEETLPG